MKILSTKIHGVFDYMAGIVLILSPWLLAFAEGGAETWIPIFLGASAILYSLLTDYEAGIYKMIPIKAHFALDIASGILLAVSPWMFGFANSVFIPHLIAGILEIVIVLITKAETLKLYLPSRKHRPAM